MIVGKDASETGQVMVTHNEDDGGRAMVHHGYVEPRDWPEGTVLPAENGRAAIPQVSHTLGYYWSQEKPAAGGYSNADAFFNDAGVLIVSNSNASSKVDTTDDSRVTDGGIEYNLRRVLAERSTSARHGVEICIDMIETWGYAPSGRAYTIADKNEAWMVQIVSGKYYVAVRCPDDAVIVMPNHYTVHDIFAENFVRGENILYPDDLIDYAKEKGFYVEIDGKFDFAASYQAGGAPKTEDGLYVSSGSYRGNGNTYRQFYGTQMLLDGVLSGPRPANTEGEYPLFVNVPDGSVTLERLMAVQTEHYEGTPEDAATDRAPGGNPHDTTLRRICTGTTDESLICVFEETPLLTTLWTSFGHPCELPYIPLHPLAGVPTQIDQMPDSDQAMADHLLPDPQRALYADFGWNAFRDIQMKIDLTHKDSYAGLEEVNQQFYAQAMVTNAKAIAAAKADPEQAAAMLASFGQSSVDLAQEYLENYVAGYVNEVAIEAPVIKKYDPTGTIDVVFTAPKGGAPVESTLRFVMGMLNTRTASVAPVEGSLKAVEGGYQVSFSTEAVLSKINRYTPVDGEYDFFLGGETEEGLCFTGMTLADVLLQPSAAISLTGPDAAILNDGTVDYTVSVAGAEGLATATLTFALDGYTGAVVVPAEGWEVLTQTCEDGVVTAVLYTLEGISGDADIATVVTDIDWVGAAGVELTEAVMSAYLGDAETFVTAACGETVVETVIDFHPCDVNQDGVVNQLDITRAQRFFGIADEICDVTGDGTVNTADLIMILNNYTA